MGLAHLAALRPARSFGAASEVLLREAHDLCGLPVAVFRPGMILAHSRYAGQCNVTDMFTRIIFSLAVTGIAPATFYAQDLSNGRPQACCEGHTVDFLADAITAIDAADALGFNSYNLALPQDDSVSFDDFVDWMVEAGCNIEKVDGYDDWLARFETAMTSLPDEQRAESMLHILDPYRRPQSPVWAAGSRPTSSGRARQPPVSRRSRFPRR